MVITIKRGSVPWLKPLSVSVLMLVLVSCNGDLRPLEEQIEAIDLDVASIAITLPPNSLSPFFLGSNQAVQLGILGTTFDGQSIALNPDDRRWTSSDISVVSVNDDGVVTGRAEGMAQVSVSVAGMTVMQPLSINVSNAPLQSIARISGSADNTADVNSMLDPCIPITFAAIGSFGGVDERPLINVNWTIDEASEMADAELFTTAATTAGAVELVGRSPSGGGVAGDIILTATVPAEATTGSAALSASRTLSVADSLVSFAVAPTDVTVMENNTTRLTAPAGYNLSSVEFATNGADWEVTQGENVASVESVGGTPGLVTGLDIGTATVTARCGAFVESTVVVVAAGSDDIVFNRNADIIIFLSDDPEFNDLRVARGDDFDTNNEITDEVDFFSSNTSVVTVDSTGDDRGDLTAVGLGSATISAEFEDARISITVEVR